MPLSSTYNQIDGVQIRKARREDLERLRALWRQLDALHAEVQPGFFRLPQEPRPAAALGQALGGWDVAILVAGRDGSGEVLGTVSVRLLDTPHEPLMSARRRGLVEDLIVDRQHRHTGIGAALMEAAAAWSRRRGAAHLLLTVWEGNRAAEAFYARLGYGPINRVLGLDLELDP